MVEKKEIAKELALEERGALLRKLDYNGTITGAVFTNDLKKTVGEPPERRAGRPLCQGPDRPFPAAGRD
jgi:hypothetical protein